MLVQTMRGLACSAEFMRRFERLAKEAGWTGNGGPKKRAVDALVHHFCLNKTQVYDLLRSIEIRYLAGIPGNRNEVPHPTILTEAARAGTAAGTIAKEAVEKGWTAQEVRQAVRRQKLRNVPPLPAGKFFVVYADPPWAFDNSGLSQSAERQYPTMPVESIAALAVSELVTTDGVLFLWIPVALLPDGLAVCSAWGFKYKTHRVWIKDRAPGIGWFLLTKHEMLLIGTKGKDVQPELKPVSWFRAPAGRHSAKPGIVYRDIEAMYPGRKYVELFARQQHAGWTAWGNEIRG